ncbi:transposase InsO family protein [Anoxybacillus tepidamans]|uniref:Transposase InsO family protein n=1 Tax=Anoxybacteroides tepidamans TaxID=265948 RepID=A0A7W8IRV4_9BACL|nr:transposase InsO family protein [Anoxybacillus tepidamans]
MKQIIERFHRTFKGNYRPTHGFGAEEGSVSFVTLFVAYFNFLRPHGALESRVPVVLPELDSLPHMPARWGKLIAMAQDFLEQQAV